jgi:uncharacterized protein YbjT (DUF2867 family)
MKLIIFGSTGGVGRQVVSHALDTGHQVILVARRPEMLAIQRERLQEVRGDVVELEQRVGTLAFTVPTGFLPFFGGYIFP